MYVLVISSKSAPGMGGETNALFAEFAEYLNRAFPPASPFRVYRELFGNRDTVHMTSGWDSLADIERFYTFMAQDEGAVKRFKEWNSSGLPVPGSGKTRVLLAL